MNKSIFGTRFKNELKSQGYTFVSFAKKLGYTEDAIKRWTRTKNPSMPNLETMRKIADILNVDMSYLLGDQECRHHEEQTIMDVTGLSQEACENLAKLRVYDDNPEKIVFNELLKNDNFTKFLNCLFKIWTERTLSAIDQTIIASVIAETEINYTDYEIFELFRKTYKGIDPNIILEESKKHGLLNEPKDILE